MAEYTARVLHVVEHGPALRSLFLERPPSLAFVPGQFLSFRLEVGGQTLTKPYTIASAPEEPAHLEILFDRVPGGAGSTHLFARGPGDPLHCTGPWGAFALDRAPDAEAIFVAHGTGIAAIRPMLQRAARTASHPLHLVYGTRTPVYVDELRGLAGLDVTLVEPEALADVVRDRWIDADADRTRHFYVCGIGTIVPTLRDLLRGAGYARRAVQYEKW